MYQCLSISYLLVLAIAMPTAGFLVRTFILFHDCTHGSLLRSKRANAWLGTVLGLFVYAPFLRWRHDHAIHHATSGDLDRRGGGDVHTLTVAEYHELAPRARLAYRLFRNPLVMFGIGPIAALLVGPRLVAKDARPRMRRSVIGTNIALAVFVGAMCWLIGWEDFLLVQAPTVMLAGSAGIWLFYVQHQFEDAYWEELGRVELRRRGAARQLLSEAAEGAAVLLGQHRPAPRPPPQRAHPQLQPAARARRERDLPRRADAVVHGRHARGAPEAVGRAQRAHGRLRRSARSAHQRQRSAPAAAADRPLDQRPATDRSGPSGERQRRASVWTSFCI